MENIDIEAKIAMVQFICYLKSNWNDEPMKNLNHYIKAKFWLTNRMKVLWKGVKNCQKDNELIIS